MKIINLKTISDELIKTFKEAGQVSIYLRQQGLKKEIKKDNTPVTNGDLEVNKILTNKINNLTKNIPIISEESSDNKNIDDLNDFWLVDPIDGTYDYVNGKDEFTINAALIINKKPKLGIIYAPAKKRLFYTFEKNECYEISKGGKIKLNCEKKTNKNQICALVYSKNLKPILKNIHADHGVTKVVRMKSSLKFCMIASGEYDFYAAEPRAMEWDIAAGHAIVENAGGLVTDFNGNEILYGKENFVNSSIILKRNIDLLK